VGIGAGVAFGLPLVSQLYDATGFPVVRLGHWTFAGGLVNHEVGRNGA
jgi:hypothetical protein